MKLIIREYLASLRERKELDALLPDLLSQMGLDVFSKPSVGGRQYGVDIAAFGSIDGDVDKVYLFSVKSGDLGRADWNGGSVQDLKPSLDEILDVYIPMHLPSEYEDKPIEICLCFGGDLKESVRLNVSAYEKKHSTESISFSHWNGEKLSMYIEQYFLREELLPEECRPLLRKSLALLDEPEASYAHYAQLIKRLSIVDIEKPEKTLTAIRQMYLCLWILYSWAREADNLECAYQASELTLLLAWDTAKPFFDKKTKTETAIKETLSAIQLLQFEVNCLFVEQKILPHTSQLYALSSAVKPSCSVDVNLKLFDLLGRLAVTGLWHYWYLNLLPDNEESIEEIKNYCDSIEQYQTAVKQLIANNPILLTPYKDDQAIDVAIASWFLSLEDYNREELHAWLLQIVRATKYLFGTKSNYPCNLNSYHELIDHPKADEGYLEEVTKGSILYPVIAAFSALHNFDDIYSIVQTIQTKYLPHCNFQIWFPDEASEEYFYNNTQPHGATFSHVKMDQAADKFLDEVLAECVHSASFDQLSAITSTYWPVIFLACRHYRMPVPMHFIKSLFHENEAKRASLVQDADAQEVNP